MAIATAMRDDQSLPHLWLISDARNDAVLEDALEKLPRGSGFIYRHHHLSETERYRRFLDLQRHARAKAHRTILADSALTAREWGAEGIYGTPRALWPRRAGQLRLATVHDLAEIGLANQLGADAALLSPVFATRSHPDEAVLGPVRFRLLARHARMPVIALGGMDLAKGRALRWPRLAAIDGLSHGSGEDLNPPHSA
ncbi:MAG: thiamine phosphate synthase [Erythrobacter sp.]